MPVREGEIQMMQMLTAAVLPVVTAVGVTWLLATAMRFKGADDRLTSHAADCASNR
jgi:hypothetical protein